MLFATATSIVLSQRCGTSYAEQKERQRERKRTIKQRARESRIGCYLNVEERETVLYRALSYMLADDLGICGAAVGEKIPM